VPAGAVLPGPAAPAWPRGGPPAMTPSELPRKLVDRTLRESLKHPAHLRALLREAVPALADAFVCEKGRLLDREVPAGGWRRGRGAGESGGGGGRRGGAALPSGVPSGRGGEGGTALVCVLVEPKSDTAPRVPLRSLYFAVCSWDRQWQQWARLPRPRPPLRL